MSSTYKSEILGANSAKLTIAKLGGSWVYRMSASETKERESAIRLLMARKAEGWTPLAFVEFNREPKGMRLNTIWL